MGGGGRKGEERAGEKGFLRKNDLNFFKNDERPAARTSLIPRIALHPSLPAAQPPPAKFGRSRRVFSFGLMSELSSKLLLARFRSESGAAHASTRGTDGEQVSRGGTGDFSIREEGEGFVREERERPPPRRPSWLTSQTIPRPFLL